MGTDNGIAIDRYGTTLIRIKAHRLVGKHGFTRSDVDDIQQEIYLRTLVRLRKFDPLVASMSTFCCLAVNHAVIDIVRERRAAFRSHELRTVQLGQIKTDDASCFDLADTCTHSADLLADLRHALDEMPDDLREVINMLAASSVMELSRQRGCSRGHMRGLIRRIKRELIKRGLHEYLPSQSEGSFRK